MILIYSISYLYYLEKLYKHILAYLTYLIIQQLIITKCYIVLSQTARNINNTLFYNTKI